MCTELHVEFQASCPGNLFWIHFNTNCGILLWPWLLPISSASGSTHLGILWYKKGLFLFFLLSLLPPSPNTLLCEYQYRVMDLDCETMENFLAQKKKKSRLGSLPQNQIWYFFLLFFSFHLPLSPITLPSSKPSSGPFSFPFLFFLRFLLLFLLWNELLPASRLPSKYPGFW